MPGMLLQADPGLIVLIALAAGILLGALFLFLLRRQDHYSWVLARAPELPIRVLAGGDDAWLRGTVRCRAPLCCPWFEVDCVSYAYRIERLHTWTTTDKDGKTQTHREWRTEHSETQRTDFELDDGQRITVRIAAADNEAERGLGTDYEHGSRRHVASALELDAEVSVLGVKQDDGSFAGEREVPCLITRKTREQRLAGSQRSEGWLFFFACFWPFAGGAVAAWFGLGQRLQPTALAIAATALGGLLAMLPFWWLGVFNRLVRLRQQVQAAFRQVDVDLAVRAGLVPNLVQVVQGYSRHESELLTSLAALRSGGGMAAATAHEPAAAATSRQVLLLHERYPELRASELYRDLHDRLWAVEEKLQHTRTLYNGVVTEWNDRIAAFPSLLVAKCCRCRQAPLFQGDDQELPPPLRDQPAGHGARRSP